MKISCAYSLAIFAKLGPGTGKRLSILSPRTRDGVFSKTPYTVYNDFHDSVFTIPNYTEFI